MQYATEGSQIQIDHLVALATAWRTGAAHWPLSRRMRFANDTRLELLAVSGSANESKGDSSPGHWLPINRGFRCTFVSRYLRVVQAYDLAITSSDAASIRVTAGGC